MKPYVRLRFLLPVDDKNSVVLDLDDGFDTAVMVVAVAVVVAVVVLVLSVCLVKTNPVTTVVDTAIKRRRTSCNNNINV